MQIERLIQMVFLLVQRERLTTREIAEYFGVSKRTVLRDINTLSLAGIPIYTTKGNGGGVQILKEYTIEKSMITEEERSKIINGLQVLQGTHFPNTEQLLTKMNALFKSNSSPNWIEVDFSFFGSEENEKIKFYSIQEAILKKHVIEFDYFNTDLQHHTRIIEPLRLLFRYQAWYLFGYCRKRQEYRLYRTSRMKDICIKDEHFDRELTEDIIVEPDYFQSENLKLFKLKFAPEIAHRVYDEFEEKYVEVAEDNFFLVSCYYAVNEWVIRHLLSFGTYVEILEPAEARELLKQRAEAVAAIYK